MSSPHLPSNASLSLPFGENSIFNHPMVLKGSASVEVMELEEHFPEKYTLTELTNSEDSDIENSALKWIKKQLNRTQHRRFSFEAKRCFPMLPGSQALHTTNIKPDVTIATAHTNKLPILTVEVYSSTYVQTVKKTVINVIEHFRLLRAYSTSVNDCVGFVFPRNREKSCVTKVTVKFVDFRFEYFLKPIDKQNVKDEVTDILTQQLWSDLTRLEPPRPCIIHLSQAECDKFHQNAVQVYSLSSLIIRNTDSTKYWKYNPKLSQKFYAVLFGRTKPCHSLFPCSASEYGGLTFFEYEGLLPPLSRSGAKKCLIPLIAQVRTALEELHNTFSIAHMDVRLPNICFTRTTFNVKLIDLDRCARAIDPPSHTLYKKSDMNTAPDGWKNYQLDWKGLGLMICFVLDDGISVEDYHVMISQNKVNATLRENDFVKCLLESGEWEDRYYATFQSHYSESNNSIDCTIMQ